MGTCYCNNGFIKNKITNELEPCEVCNQEGKSALAIGVTNLNELSNNMPVFDVDAIITDFSGNTRLYFDKIKIESLSLFKKEYERDSVNTTLSKMENILRDIELRDYKKENILFHVPNVRGDILEVWAGHMLCRAFLQGYSVANVIEIEKLVIIHQLITKDYSRMDAAERLLLEARYTWANLLMCDIIVVDIGLAPSQAKFSILQQFYKSRTKMKKPTILISPLPLYMVEKEGLKYMLGYSRELYNVDNLQVFAFKKS